MVYYRKKGFTWNQLNTRAFHGHLAAWFAEILSLGVHLSIHFTVTKDSAYIPWCNVLENILP